MIWKIIIVCVSIINIVYFLNIMQYGSRGSVLSIALLVLGLLLYKKHDDIVIIRSKRVLPIFALAIIAFVSIENVLNWLQIFFDSHGVSFRFIDKTLDLLGDNDLSNGRANITAITINGIIESPILGHGFDMFDKNTGLLYPHNFLLQLFYDGGLFLLLLVLMPVINSLGKKVTKCTLSEFSVYITLFCSGVIGALFSGNMWAQPILWLFMGVIMSKTKIV